MTRLPARGEGRLGCILWLFAAGVAIMVAVKAVPVKLADVEFADFVEEQAQFSARASGETLRERILKKARELEIPLDPSDLSVRKSKQRVQIEWTYTVTLDFGVYQYDWTFEHELDRPVFIV